MKRSSSISIRLPNELLDNIEILMKTGKFGTHSQAIRYCIELGMKVESLRPKVKDSEFLKSIDFLKEGDNMFSWMSGLTDNQLDGLVSAVHMERDERLKKWRSMI